ncbi:2Fe-2S iron-sulfur cluster-binding protein [Fictibacillus enclensis]|jgi:ferredoxin|uniref:(2Fe-2S)-binding protein n=1 Tax=Fictibacillus enclensis TaxID=1017270 RepID=A0A0V8JEF9_9BACL|nr:MULTISPECIES: 2Fe-2S iron-sulfur cluster-binding protein [Fictibacillus]KSU85256.1 (2Fe-2S)-binding protein [Fictibacillus enclensis]MDM5199092.1 2Fe-2S iron-sulfur cluster-binding protein [Fictibacillus enclensis]MDM5338275.1 2Fe-2S iron-sulfur cluster-binding protein [Fictibacillus enclensis]RXY99078.1 (2Fe-2S)-binding protein [Fictibacillus sp. S7]WHY74646.1 2Fe-2S iron-sulfur cluster-binding protein [Fictibacillus enclensis]
MAKITVKGFGEYEIENGKKLVLGLEDQGVDILHRCGGNARCTTCRVEVLQGSFGEMGEAERNIIETKGLGENIRLSCQVRVNGDAEIAPAMTSSKDGLDAGPRPAE